MERGEDEQKNRKGFASLPHNDNNGKKAALNQMKNKCLNTKTKTSKKSYFKTLLDPRYLLSETVKLMVICHQPLIVITVQKFPVKIS